MNPTFFQIGVAIFMLAVSISLVVWFFRYLAAASERRMMHMLARAGVAPEVAKHGDTEAVIRDVRTRCRRCRVEDLCDRWLAGEVEGDHSFCPNAQIFRRLARAPGRIAPRHPQAVRIAE
jgi:hypothetical protein